MNLNEKYIAVGPGIFNNVRAFDINIVAAFEGLKIFQVKIDVPGMFNAEFWL